MLRAALRQILVDSCLVNGRRPTAPGTTTDDNPGGGLGLSNSKELNDGAELVGGLESRSQYLPTNTGLS